MNEIFRTYSERVNFLCVYIREAHPTDGWAVPDNVDYAEPKTIEERAAVARVCKLRLNLEMPMLLDNMDNAVDDLYNALPERLYVLDKEGRVAWRSVAGSFGFDVEAWAEAIHEQFHQHL